MSIFDDLKLSENVEVDVCKGHVYKADVKWYETKRGIMWADSIYREAICHLKQRRAARLTYHSKCEV